MPVRNQKIDIARGILIVLMVFGHTGFAGTRFIYLFHIPCFVFVSGYLYNNQFTVSAVKKRFLGFYRPFIEYSFFYLASINLYIELGILERNYISSYNIVDSFADIILMKGLGGFLGAFWYLTMILEVYLFYLVLNRIVRKIRHQNLVILFLFLISYFLISNRINLPAYLDITALMIGVYHLGRLYRIYEGRISVNLYVALFSSLTLLFLFINGTEIDVGRKMLPNILGFILAVFSGIGLLMSVTSQMQLFPLGNVLSYVGQRTIPILGLHFLSFKIVDLVLNSLYHDLTSDELAMFPTSFTNSIFITCLYVISGIGIPLLFKHLIKLVRNE